MLTLYQRLYFSVSGGTSGERYRSHFDDFDEAVIAPFTDWANSVLPEQSFRNSLEHDAEGLPVFPPVALTQVTPEQVMALLEDYLSELWCKIFLFVCSSCT
jgi:hypothetical protein